MSGYFLSWLVRTYISPKRARYEHSGRFYRREEVMQRYDNYSAIFNKIISSETLNLVSI